MTEEKRQTIEAKIRDLMSRLGSGVSPVGDWKIVKCYEARLQGDADPYDITELMSARQAIRDEINILQAQLEEE